MDLSSLIIDLSENEHGYNLSVRALCSNDISGTRAILYHMMPNQLPVLSGACAQLRSVGLESLLENTGTLELRATERVFLHPGFHYIAHLESKFTAGIAMGCNEPTDFSSSTFAAHRSKELLSNTTDRLIKIYPNPVDNVFWVFTAEMEVRFKLELSDLQGSLLMEVNLSTNNEVNMSYLPSGMYHLVLLSAGRPIAQKRILKR